MNSELTFVYCLCLNELPFYYGATDALEPTLRRHIEAVYEVKAGHKCHLVEDQKYNYAGNALNQGGRFSVRIIYWSLDNSMCFKLVELLVMFHAAMAGMHSLFMVPKVHQITSDDFDLLGTFRIKMDYCPPLVFDYQLRSCAGKTVGVTESRAGAIMIGQHGLKEADEILEPILSRVYLT